MMKALITIFILFFIALFSGFSFAEDIPPRFVVAKWMAYYNYDYPKEPGSFIYINVCRPSDGEQIAKVHVQVELEIDVEEIPPELGYLMPVKLYWFVPYTQKDSFKYRTAFEDTSGHIGQYTDFFYYEPELLNCGEQ